MLCLLSAGFVLLLPQHKKVVAVLVERLQITTVFEKTEALSSSFLFLSPSLFFRCDSHLLPHIFFLFSFLLFLRCKKDEARRGLEVGRRWNEERKRMKHVIWMIKQYWPTATTGIQLLLFLLLSSCILLLPPLPPSLTHPGMLNMIRFFLRNDTKREVKNSFPSYSSLLSSSLNGTVVCISSNFIPKAYISFRCTFHDFVIFKPADK